MKNEWGAELDRNGYAMRSKSKRMGLWVSLCHTPCHLTHAHGCAEVMDLLHRLGEQACIDNYDFTIPMFREEFYTNYLEETEC